MFQIGANEGEEMGTNIGDMWSYALGLSEVLVTNRASAAHSITVIDEAGLIQVQVVDTLDGNIVRKIPADEIVKLVSRIRETLDEWLDVVA